MHHRAISLLVLVLGFCEVTVFGSWLDRTAGLPPVEIISAKTMGVDGSLLTLTQDKIGRIFVGSNRLLVFDGQTWLSFPKPNYYPITSLVFSEDGKLWTGTTNDLGYFLEDNLGVFSFHSLLAYLPKEARDIGIVWGCAPVGPVTYFICRDKILKWNGAAFQITPFETKLRLCPMKLDNEWWFYHYETGLYRLTEKGPKLEIPSTQLKNLAVMGLFRDETGLVTISNQGFIRPGNPTTLTSELDLNDYLQKHLVSNSTELPNGDLLIGTISGGVVLANRSGKMIRIWDSSDGLPGRTIHGLTVDHFGEVMGVTPTDFFHFPADGETTCFNAKNGLTGDVVNFLISWKSILYAGTEDGIFHQNLSIDKKSQFTAIPLLAGVFSDMLPYKDGLLLTRFGGIDWFDGTAISSVYRLSTDTFVILHSRNNSHLFYVSETYGLACIEEQSNGSLLRTSLIELPDTCHSLYEDSTGKLWIGTSTRGAFSYNPATKILTPFNDPENGQPLPGSVKILGNDQRILILFSKGILQIDADGQIAHALKNVPAFVPLDLCYTLNGQDILVTYQRMLGANQLSYGAGVISFLDHDQINWRELDIPSLETIGPIRSLTFSEENDRPILWLGGTEGILRLDYDKIHTLQPPPAPIIKSDDSLRAVPTDRAANSFPFKDHHVRLMVFTGDYVRGKDWLIQTRMDGGEWANPSPRRAFEFTNLSEGEYHFEARALNSANMASAPATLTFNILPPWYRSGGAYTGYASGLALFVFGFIRVRERRIRSRNRELETMVARRTEELVKANAAKDEFLASVSHEIRNPMNGVIGIAESFKTDAFDPDSRHKFALLRQCATHLSSLLESLLDFSRLQAGVFELDSKPFDLPELMESIAALTAAESEKRRLPVEIAISPAVPRQLTGDPRRIGQILLNFVRNALNFSDHGQISVTVWCTAAGPGLTEVFFAVSDEGPGISPEEQKKLFTRFERGTAAQRGRVPGTGLGLALCRTLAEKMGGRIWLESELGQGSCFYFSAPFITEDKPIPPVAAINTPLQGGLKTALVVDDEEYNRIALADLLELLGFTVQTAADGQQAISLAGENDFDVIFLDYAMPGLSGLDVTRAIRILPNRSHQAVIFAVTAFNTPDKRTQCLAAGMNGFLGKPITMERLRQALAAAIPQEPLMLQPPSDASTPIDPLARLRVLARKKGVPLSDELALYLSDLEAELEQLTSALQHEGVHESGHYAHLLCGRCVFIQEHELEFTLRKIGPAVATGRWNDARSLGGEVRTRVADLRIRLASDAPVAPRG